MQTLWAKFVPENTNFSFSLWDLFPSKERERKLTKTHATHCFLALSSGNQFTSAWNQQRYLQASILMKKLQKNRRLDLFRQIFSHYSVKKKQRRLLINRFIFCSSPGNQFSKVFASLNKDKSGKVQEFFDFFFEENFSQTRPRTAKILGKKSSELIFVVSSIRWYPLAQYVASNRALKYINEVGEWRKRLFLDVCANFSSKLRRKKIRNLFSIVDLKDKLIPHQFWLHTHPPHRMYIVLILIKK